MKVQKKQEHKEKQVQEDKQEIRALSPTYSRTDSQTSLNTAS